MWGGGGWMRLGVGGLCGCSLRGVMVVEDEICSRRWWGLLRVRVIKIMSM